MDEISQAIGHLQGRMDSADLQRERLELKIDQQGEKLDVMLGYIERQKGAVRVLMVVSTMTASIFGALAAWASELFKGHHP